MNQYRNQPERTEQPVNPVLIFGRKLVEVWLIKEIEGLAQPFSGYMAYNDTLQIVLDTGGAHIWLPKNLVASIITSQAGVPTDAPR